MKKNSISRKLFISLNTVLVAVLMQTGVSFISVESAFAQTNGSNASKPVNNAAGGQAKRIKYKKDTKVDFDDELIEGGVKNPFQSMIGGRDGDNKSGFIKIRREWHDQMIMSVNGLSQ